MVGEPPPERASGSRRPGGVRRAIVFLVVLGAAALLGRLGSGAGPAPVLEVDQSAGERSELGTGVDGASGAEGAAGPWRPLPAPGLRAREAHTAVWSGDAVLVWGGYGPYGSGDGLHNDGAAYGPAAGRWEPIPPAPLRGLVNHTVVWTGAEMIVWGGAGGGGDDGAGGGGDRGRAAGPGRDRGAAYDPAAGRWRLLAPDPLGERQEHTAVWAARRAGAGDDAAGDSAAGGGPAEPAGRGSAGRFRGEMIVWGGLSGEPQGAAYDPAADRWRVLPPAPGGTRRGHTATWTGSEMVVVGGSAGGRAPDAPVALAYEPAVKVWRALPDPPGGARQAHTSVWNGQALVVWGGVGPDGRPAAPTGVAYNPDADAWSVLPEPPDAPRAGHVAVWTGEEMVVWGGVGRGGRPAGLAYDPARDRWRALPDPPLGSRVPPRLLWTGEELITLDGRSLSGALALPYPQPAGSVGVGS